jgi:hypothetical protein
MTSSKRMAHLASKAMKIKHHGDLTLEEIRELGASVESQRQDVSKRPQEKRSRLSVLYDKAKKKPTY